MTFICHAEAGLLRLI